MASLWRAPSPPSPSPGKGNPTSAAADGNDDASEQGGAASVAAKRANAAGGSSETPLPSPFLSPFLPLLLLLRAPFPASPPSGKGRQRSSPSPPPAPPFPSSIAHRSPTTDRHAAQLFPCSQKPTLRSNRPIYLFYLYCKSEWILPSTIVFAILSLPLYFRRDAIKTKTNCIKQGKR